MVLFILFPGYQTTKYFWEKDLVKNKIVKVRFLKKLKKLGDIYTYTPNIYNIGAYYKKYPKKIQKVEDKFHDKPHKISLDDIDIDKQCKLIYDKVKHYKGKFIPIGHSMGGIFALHFSKLYPIRCNKVILIESSSIISKKLYKQQLMYKKMYNVSNKDLENLVDKIKNTKDNDKLLYKLDDITYNYYYKIFNKKIKQNIIPILLFNAIYVTDDKKEDNKFNKLQLEGVDELYKIYKNKLNVVNFVNTYHFPWFIPKYSDEMIRQIKCFVS